MAASTVAVVYGNSTASGTRMDGVGGMEDQDGDEHSSERAASPGQERARAEAEESVTLVRQMLLQAERARADAEAAAHEAHKEAAEAARVHDETEREVKAAEVVRKESEATAAKQRAEQAELLAKREVEAAVKAKQEAAEG